ncbi:MAG: hypothetical protein GY724_05245 [Actinomycetia bacterium]|nr:hypothetical protein [Actinomycetes bacterium]MCP4226218.1 hypothetical protein [Actinomycetes bacterium]
MRHSTMGHRSVNQQMRSVIGLFFGLLAILVIVAVGGPAAAQTDPNQAGDVGDAASTLDDVQAINVYLQADSVAQAEDSDDSEIVQEETVAESGDPFLSDLGYILVALVPVLIAAVVFASRLVAPTDRLSLSRFDAWLKTAVIVAVLVLAVVVLPDFILSLSAVAELDRVVQDLIGLAVWGGGLIICLWGLWYAHRESRI